MLKWNICDFYSSFSIHVLFLWKVVCGDFVVFGFMWKYFRNINLNILHLIPTERLQESVSGIGIGPDHVKFVHFQTLNLEL